MLLKSRQEPETEYLAGHGSACIMHVTTIHRMLRQWVVVSSGLFCTIAILGYRMGPYLKKKIECVPLALILYKNTHFITRTTQIHFLF